jgi:hypothetical protein
MTTPLKFIASRIFATACAFASTTALAGGAGHPAVDVQASAGYFTYKSKYVLSNDTGLRYDYQGVLYAGDSRDFALVVRGNMQTTDFALVSKKLDSSATDLVIRLYIGDFYLGPVVGIQSLAFSEGGATPTFDLTDRHYGGNIGAEFEISRNTALRLDVLATMQYDYKEVSKQTITLGTRIDSDLSLEVPISKRFSAIIGGKYMMYALQSQAEAITMPYGGIKVDMDF